MPALSALLRHVFGSETVRYECRHCGTSLQAETDECPECGAADVATYRFDS